MAKEIVVRNFFKVSLASVVCLLLMYSTAHANTGITYHGRIVRPAPPISDGKPVSSPQVGFKIQIRTPGTENCLLWEEQQTKDLSSTSGVFSITIADTNEPTLIQNTLPFPLERVFSNRSPFNALTGCSAGSSYNPTPTDGRSLVVFFRENPSDPWEQMPVTKINFVPMSLNSLQLEGYSASEFLKVDPTSVYTPLSAGQVNVLMDLIAGTNSQYLKPGDAFSGDVTGTYNATVVEKIRGTNVVSTAPTSGQVLKFDGTNWVPSADDSGVTSDASYSAKGIVQINTDQATSGLYINNGVLALPNVIVGAGPIGDAQTIPVITYDQKGRLTAVTTATVDDDTKLPLAGGTMQGSIDMGTHSITNATNIASTNISTRNVVLNDNDSNTITINAPVDVTPGNYTLTLPAAKGVNGQVLALDALGNFEWISPSTGSLTGLSSTNAYLTIDNSTPATPALTVNVGAVANTVAAGDDPRITGALQKTDYADDLADVDTCTSVQKPSWNTVSDKWECVAIGTVPESVDFTGSLAGDVTGTQGATVVEKIRGTNVVSTAPTNGQVLKFDGTNWVPSADEEGLTAETDPNVEAWAKQAPAARFITTGDTLDLATRVPFASADPAVGQDGQTLRWNNNTSSWEWFTAGAAGSGLQSLGGQTGNTQTFASTVDNTKTAPEISSASDVHTFRYPMASTNGVTAGLISKTEYDSFVAKLTSPLTTKGDMLSHDGTDHVRLPVGTDGQVLAADSSEASGLKWVTPTTGTVTQVTSANSYISVANTTTTPEITANVGTTANTLAAGDDARITGALQAADYATDVADAASCGADEKPSWNSGTTKWECVTIGTVAESVDFTGNLAGDVTGTQGATVVEKIRGTNVVSTAPTNGQVLKFDGTNWVPSADEEGLTAETDPNVQAWAKQAPAARFITTGDTLDLATRVPFASADPAVGQDGQTLRWDNSTSTWVWFTPGVAGSGLQSLGGQTGNTQTFASTVDNTKTAPEISSASDVHTFRYPMASTNGVTAGLVSKAEYDSFVAKLTSPLTTKGDMLSHDGTDHVRLPVGTDGQVLAADSSEASGLKWITPTVGTLTGISSTNAYLTVDNSIPATPALTVNVGTTANTVAAGDDARIVGALQKTDYADDLADVDTCTSVQKPSWNTVSDKWECVAIGTVPESVDFTGSLAGDVTGTQGATVVEKIRGTNVVSTAPTNGQVLKFDGTNWVPSADSGLTSETDPNVQAWAKQAPAARFITTGDTLDLATRVPFASADPAVGQDGQTLRWDNSTSTWVWFTPGVAGSGLQSLGGQTGNTQTFASSVDNTKTAPEISSASDVHTFRYPMAATNGVTAGLISKTEYDSFVAKLTSPLTTKGDMLSHDGTDHVRLPVGTDGQVLAADSSEASGLKWVTPQSGDITEVVAGNGLTDGGTSGSVTLNVGAGTGIVVNADDIAVDVGTTDGKIVQVQTGGKLPALDGSDLTNLDAGDIASGVLPIARGGTGQGTANDALNALLPTQATHAGKVLQTDGTNTSWQAITSGTVTEVTSANSYISITDGTTTPEITANVGTTANTLAAGDDARIVGALQAADYATDLEDVDTCTNTQTVYWNSVSEKWACQNIDFSASGAFVNGGNSFGANAILGTNDNYALNFKTNNATQMTILNDGKVGIGTASPDMPLSVGDGSAKDGSIIARGYGAIGTGDSLTAAGAGRRMIWYAKKGAFRAGTVNGTQWDDANIGNNSVAMGNNAQAGVSSIAMGNGTVADDYSVAMGSAANATGSASIALGYGPTASGVYAVAFGNDTDATGHSSTAMGDKTLASGQRSTATGGQTTAAGNYSFTTGRGTKADALAQVTIGHYNVSSGAENATTWVATDPLFVIGNGPSVGSPSNALMLLKNGDMGLGSITPSTKLDIDGAITQRGMAAPALSPAGQGRIYFDSTSNTFKISQNGGAYADVLTSASGVGDITDVTAGAGLTGGASSGNATLAVGAGTGIVVNADDIAVDVGTTDGKIVQVQTGGKLPALDGSSLTNIFPAQTGNGGKFLTTDGSAVSWSDVTSGTVTGVTSANSYISIANGTTTPEITANVGTAANTLAAGNDARIVGALQAADYATDLAGAASCDGDEKPYWNGTSDKWECTAITGFTYGSGTTNAIPRFTDTDTLGDSGLSDNGTVITATRSIAVVTNPIATGATINLATSNTHTLASVGGTTITINNPADGGLYNIVIEDTTSRTYTFSGCTNSYFKPVNGPTQDGTRTVYGLLTVKKGANWDCYITWSSGFQ